MKKNIAIMFLAFLLSGTLFCNDFVLGRKMQNKLKKLIIILIFLFSFFNLYGQKNLKQDYPEAESLFTKFQKTYSDYDKERKTFHEKEIVKLTLLNGNIFESFQPDDYNFIIDCTPELWHSKRVIESPYKTYHENRAPISLFSGTAEEITYFLLYTKLLRKTKTCKMQISDEVRKNIISILQYINDAYSYLGNGGKYYIDESIKIEAYAEYYLYKLYEKEEKKISETQKEQVCSSFWFVSQYLFDYSEDVFGNGNTPEMIYKKMSKIKTCMESIDMLITNSFYLEATLEYINSKMQE